MVKVPPVLARQAQHVVRQLQRQPALGQLGQRPTDSRPERNLLSRRRRGLKQDPPALGLAIVHHRHRCHELKPASAQGCRPGGRLVEYADNRLPGPLPDHSDMARERERELDTREPPGRPQLQRFRK